MAACLTDHEFDISNDLPGQILGKNGDLTNCKFSKNGDSTNQKFDGS